jgi:hypothetical protein
MNAASAGARIFAAAIALAAATGLAVQLHATFGRTGSVGATLWIMFRYFTIIGNTMTVVVFAEIAFGGRRFVRPAVLGGITLTMLLIGIVYGLLLRGLRELSGDAWLADFLLHTVTPLLVPLFWLIAARKGGLTRTDPLIWASVPLVYFAYAMVRAAADGIYPYPFMNVAIIGGAQTAINAAAIAAGFLVAGFGLVWLDRRLAPGETARKPYPGEETS